MTLQPKVSIVILNFNGLKDSLECLASLYQITYSNYEVIVVDNGSAGKDASIIKQKFPQTKIVENQINLGFAEGNNIAIRQLLKSDRTKYILLLNNDTVVTDKFLNHLITAAQNQPTSGIIGPKIYHYSPSEKKAIQSIGSTVDLSRGRFLSVNPRNNQPQSVDFVTGACLLIKPSVINKIGLLDKAFFCIFEDADWCLKAKKAGYPVLYVPQSIIYHKQSQSLVDPAKTYYYTRNLFWFEFRHANRLQLILFLGYYFVTVFSVYFIGLLLVKRNYQTWKSYLNGIMAGLFAHKSPNKYLGIFNG